jgi:hypothetical protein
MKSIPNDSSGPSARTLAKSFTLHGLVGGMLLVLPAGSLRHSAPPKEIEVVFHRSEPRIQIASSAIPLPPGPATEVLRKPGRVESPGRRDIPPQPGPSAIEEPVGIPDLPPGPEPPVVEELPPQPKVKPGILAFKDQLANIAKDKVTPRLGTDARYSNADDASRASSSTVLTTNSPGSGSGINVASLSRSLGGGGGRGGGGGGPLAGGGGGDGGGGGGGGGIGRVEVESPITPGGERPLSNGPGPARTDEEIQIVFDRYKASFYRLYHRELRKDPTLQGQMVLRLTIEPDGSVSFCVLQSTDMNAPDLATDVVNRTRTINFGAKEGVQALTIVYPIDFLPAT